MEYEQNVHDILKLAPHMKSGDIKKAIASYLIKKQTETPENWQDVIHHQLLTCAPQTILTTNYDYFLEQAIDNDFKAGAASTKETLYSKERYREVGGYRIYHIHGETSGPASICLGYEQYVGSIQYIRAEIVKSTDKAPNRFHLADVLNGRAKRVRNCAGGGQYVFAKNISSLIPLAPLRPIIAYPSLFCTFWVLRIIVTPTSPDCGVKWEALRRRQKNGILKKC